MKAEDFYKAECPFCQQPIEVPVGYPEWINCPNESCGKSFPPEPQKIIATPPPLPPPLPVKISEQKPIWHGNESSFLEIKLTSGTLFEINSIKLFNAKNVQQLAMMKTEAEKKLGGVSTGLMPWGSLSWVLMASFAISTVESVLSSKAAKQGGEIVQNYIMAEKKLRNEGVFFPVGMIDGMDRAIPSRWNISEQPCYPDGFILDGDEFIVLKDREGIVHSIRWSAVEYYNYHANNDESVV